MLHQGRGSPRNRQTGSTRIFKKITTVGAMTRGVARAAAVEATFSTAP